MNQSIFYFFYNFAHQSTFLDKVIVFFAFYFPYLVVILAGLFILFHHEVFRADNPLQVFLQKKKEIFKAFFAGSLAWVLAQVLKFLFSFSRPAEALASINPLITKSDYSFPSGHATFFMALAVSIFFFHKKAGYIFIFFALIIGITRIMSGVHFPVDILGGFVLGATVAYFVKNV